MISRHTFLGLALFGAMALSLPAQGTLHFTNNDIEVAANGAGGHSTMPGNQTAVFERGSILSVTPANGGPYSARPCADQATWSAFFGDDDNNGNFANVIVDRVDALHLAPGAASPPSLFDFYLSFSTNVGPQGTTQVNRADIFRLLPGGGAAFFMTKELFRQAVGVTLLPSSFDIDAFTIDAATGDLYFSADNSFSLHGLTTVNKGAVLRIPGSALTLDAQGLVSAVVFGSAELVLSEAEVHGLFLAAGLNGISNLEGLEIEPAGGVRTSTSTGLSHPQLWMNDRDSNDGAHVVSTAGGGSIAVLNGVPLQGGPAFGLDFSQYSQGFTPGPLRGIAYDPSGVTTAPLFLDTTSTGRPANVSGVLDVHVGGATPSAAVLLVASFAVGATPGSFTPRLDIANSVYAPVFTAPGSYPELYVFNFADPLLAATVAMPFTVATDSLGYGIWTLPHGPLPAGLAVVLQTLDPATGALSTPVIPVFQ